MKKDQMIENQEFTSYWLSHGSADVVFEWLRENMSKYHEARITEIRYYLEIAEEIETVLVERNEPLINLGLALYVNLSEKTALSLFRNGDHTIKKAVLAGPSIARCVFSFSWLNEVLREILGSFDKERKLLESLLLNKFIPDDFLRDLYERREPFECLTDLQWLLTLQHTASNPRLSIPYDGEWDFMSEMSYDAVCTAGWKLFKTVPVNNDSAVVLSELGNKLIPSKPHDMDVFATIKRWKIDNDRLGWSFKQCRFALARLIGEYGSDFESLKDSTDIALRKSYFARFRTRKPEEVRELFEKDNDKFLDAALYNPKLYMNEAVREELRQCCWDYKHPHHELDYPNTFRRQVERFTQEHPEWFADYDGDIPFNEIKDPILRTNKHIEFLQKRVKIISQKLIGSESEDQPSLIDEMKTKIDEVKITLIDSNRFFFRKTIKVDSNTLGLVNHRTTNRIYFSKTAVI